MSTSQRQAILRLYQEEKHSLELFRSSVHKFFEEHPLLTGGDSPAVHSVRSRLKDEQHLLGKIERKKKIGRKITPANFFSAVTDLAGVRVLMLHQGHFEQIHQAIVGQFDRGDWYKEEEPKVYSWDPDSTRFFARFGLNAEIKESNYTSVHYLVRPRKDSRACCEIQVRTLFEEVWAELEHRLNYPVETLSVPCKDQLRVLAKLIGAGSRLADSIVRTADEAKHGTGGSGG